MRRDIGAGLPKLFAFREQSLCIRTTPLTVSGSFGGFQFELQDLGRTRSRIRCGRPKIVAGSRQGGDLTGLFTSFTANDPQQLVQIDREKAKPSVWPISHEVTQAPGRVYGSAVC